ncbi:MAG: hypothetical protein AAFU03_06055 [Bacteroidota bacterium]
MLHHINILLHVTAAIAALIIAFFAYGSVKGGARHRLYGRIFVGLMATVVITAFNGVLFFIDQPFLTVVTFQSFYYTYSGYRVLKTKDRGPQHIDFIIMLLVGITTIGFLVYMATMTIKWNMGILYTISGWLLTLIAYDIHRYFYPHLLQVKSLWLYEHIFKMSGAVAALISAGMGTVMQFWQPYNQIIPAILTSLGMVFVMVYFPRKMKLGNSFVKTHGINE